MGVIQRKSYLLILGFPHFAFSITCLRGALESKRFPPMGRAWGGIRRLVPGNSLIYPW